MQEVKRICRRKNRIVFLCCVLANICLFFYVQTRQGGLFSEKKDIDRYCSLLTDARTLSIDQAKEYIAALNKQAKKDRLEKETQITQYLSDKIDYVAQYPASISYVLENAKRMNRFSIFTKPNSFSYYNIQKTIADFDNMKELSLPLDNDLATEALAGYSGMGYISFIFILYILYQMLDERENGILPMIHASPAGRLRLAAVRQAIIAGVALFSLFVLFATTAVCALIYFGGAADLGNPVQTIASFSRYVFRHSKLQFLIQYYFKMALVLYALSCLVWLILVVFRDRKLVLGVMAGVYGLEYLLYTKISIHSVYRMFHHINILSLFSFGDISSRYLNVGIRSWVVSAEGVILSVCGLVCVAAPVAAALLYARMRPKTPRAVFENLTRKIRIVGQKGLCRSSTVGKEIYKAATAGNGLLFVAALVVLTVYFCAGSQMHFTEAQQQLDRKYLEMGGKDYTELEQYCIEIRTRLEQAQEKMKPFLGFVEEDYDHDEYTRVFEEFNDAQMEYKAVTEYVNKLDYLHQLEENTGIHGYMMSDRGYDEIIGVYAQKRELILLLCLSCVLVLIISETFHTEYRSKMYHLIRTTPNGRNWVFTRKCAAAGIAVVVLFVLTYGIDLLYWIRFYGLPYLEAPVQSLYSMEQYPLHITILEFVLIKWLLSFMFILMAAAMVTALMILAGDGNGKSALTVSLTASLAGAYWLHKHGMGHPAALLFGMGILCALFVLAAAKSWTEPFFEKRSNK